MSTLPTTPPCPARGSDLGNPMPQIRFFTLPYTNAHLTSSNITWKLCSPLPPPAFRPSRVTDRQVRRRLRAQEKRGWRDGMERGATWPLTERRARVSAATDKGTVPTARRARAPDHSIAHDVDRLAVHVLLHLSPAGILAHTHARAPAYLWRVSLVQMPTNPPSPSLIQRARCVGMATQIGPLAAIPAHPLSRVFDRHEHRPPTRTARAAYALALALPARAARRANRPCGLPMHTRAARRTQGDRPQRGPYAPSRLLSPRHAPLFVFSVKV